MSQFTIGWIKARWVLDYHWLLQ